MERNRNDIVNKMHGFGRSIKTGDLNDNQTNTPDSENLEEEADVSGKNETDGSSTTHANVSDYENVEGDYAPSGVNETDDSIMATKSRTEVVTSGIIHGFKFNIRLHNVSEIFLCVCTFTSYFSMDINA